MSTARLGSFDDLLAEIPSETAPQVKSIAQALREVILEDYLEAVEIVRLGDGAASYGVGSKKMSEAHVYVMPKRSYVNLGFYHGANLIDPQKLLEGTGKKMRHVKVRSVEEAKSETVRDLIAEALAERKQALDL